MTEPKLLEVLRVFSPTERESFKLFLSSPYCVQEHAEPLLQLYRYMIEHLDTPADFKQKEAVWTAVFPDKAYSRSRMFTLMYQLYGHAEQFLRIEYYQHTSREYIRLIDSLTIYRNRRNETMYKRAFQEASAFIEAPKHQSVENQYAKFLLRKEEYEWLSANNSLEHDLLITALTDQLDSYARLFKQLLRNELMLQERYVGPQMKILDRNPDTSGKLLLQLYEQVGAILSKELPAEPEIVRLMETISQYEDMFDSALIKELLTYVRNNFVVYFDNRPLDKEMIDFRFRMYKEHLEKGYLYYYNCLQPTAFLNLVAFSLMAGASEWTLHLLETHQGRLLGSAEDALKTHRLGYAIYYFNLQQYERALDFLEFPAGNPMALMTAKRLELKVYFELQSDLFEYKLEAFRKYLDRTASKSISSYRYQMNMGFAQMLMQIRTEFLTPKRKVLLTRRLYAKAHVADKPWLLKKINGA